VIPVYTRLVYFVHCIAILQNLLPLQKQAQNVHRCQLPGATVGGGAIVVRVILVWGRWFEMASEFAKKNLHAAVLWDFYKQTKRQQHYRKLIEDTHFGNRLSCQWTISRSVTRQLVEVGLIQRRQRLLLGRVEGERAALMWCRCCLCSIIRVFLERWRSLSWFNVVDCVVRILVVV